MNIPNVPKIPEISFISVPLVVLIIAPGLHDANGIPKLIALAIGTFAITIINYKKISLNSIYKILPWMLVIAYAIIQLIKPSDFQHFLLGAFFRNGGLIALISFALIFSVISNLDQKTLKLL